MKKIIFLLICSLIITSLFAQQKNNELRTKSSKAIKLYKKGIDAVENQDFKTAIVYFDEALKIDNQFIEAWIVKGDCFMFQKECENALNSYYIALKIDSNYYPNLFYLIADQEVQCEKYHEAVYHYETYLEFNNNFSGRTNAIQKSLQQARFCAKMKDNPVKFNAINMGNNINSSSDEYLPSITADEQTFVLTVRRPRDIYTECDGCKTEEDFYISTKDKNGEWLPRRAMKEINTHYNEGAQCLSPDGKYLIFTVCNRKDGFGSCDLYWSKRIGNIWTTPRNCGRPVNTDDWESQPTFAADGKTIYFTSNRYGSVGGSDIWSTTMISDGEFSRPENLGTEINTRGEDVSPFIHPDGVTLYFSSDGHQGMGGKDLFMSRMDTADKWGKPTNLGYPINSPADEINLIVNANGDKAYLSSSKIGGFGGLDLYWFDLDERIRPTPVTYFKGKVYDEKTKIPLEANVELIDLRTGKTFIKTISDANSGEFLICLPTNNDYALNVNHEEYLFYSDNFSLTGIHSKTDPFVKDVPLKSFNIGQTVVLHNIFFDTDMYILKDASKIELERLIAFMAKNKRIKIEIGGHTDNQGSKEHNIILSQNRAQAVYNFLLKAGITKDRLSFKGYGMNTPVSTNETAEGRALNRRTEFKIIGF